MELRTCVAILFSACCSFLQKEAQPHAALNRSGVFSPCLISHFIDGVVQHGCREARTFAREKGSESCLRTLDFPKVAVHQEWCPFTNVRHLSSIWRCTSWTMDTLGRDVIFMQNHTYSFVVWGSWLYLSFLCAVFMLNLTMSNIWRFRKVVGCLLLKY